MSSGSAPAATVPHFRYTPPKPAIGAEKPVLLMSPIHFEDESSDLSGMDSPAAARERPAKEKKKVKKADKADKADKVDKADKADKAEPKKEARALGGSVKSSEAQLHSLLKAVPATQSYGNGGGGKAVVEEPEVAGDRMSSSSVSAAGGGGGGGCAQGRVVVTAEELVANVKENLVEQRRRHLEQNGERLTIMCIGESGSGKTTLAQSLFVQPIPRRSLKTARTLDIEESAAELVLGSGEATVTIHLRIVDSPGYGDAVDVQESFKKVSDYIEDTFKSTMRAEKAAVRPDYATLGGDCGVDAVLYFIAPHRLKELDVQFLRRIHKIASVLPIISKADTMTSAELSLFREEVKEGLHEGGIETFADPFAVVCCAVSEEHGEVSYSRGREYPWGTALSDDPTHSDLPRLRETLLTEGLQDLHEARSAKYEAYRRAVHLKEEGRWKGVVGGLRRLRRFVVIVAVHTLMGVAAVKGVQKRLEGRREEEANDGRDLLKERPRGFFGRREREQVMAPPPPRMKGPLRRIFGM